MGQMISSLYMLRSTFGLCGIRLELTVFHLSQFVSVDSEIMLALLSLLQCRGICIRMLMLMQP